VDRNFYKPGIKSDIIEFTNAILKMPLNSSSGVDSRTGLQYLSEIKWKDFEDRYKESERY
jgi:hypothetical protein